MKTTTNLAEELRQLFIRPDRGATGLVDDLLEYCPDDGLRLEWSGGQCHARMPADSSDILVTLPTSKSTFRGLLARVAVLCNEDKAGSVSPYGGQGEIETGTDPSSVICVSFVSTPDDQHMDLSRSH